MTKQLKPVPCREDTIVCAAFSLPSQQHQPEPQSKASSPFPTMMSDIVGGETHLEDRAGHVQVKGLFPTKHLS